MSYPTISFHSEFDGDRIHAALAGLQVTLEALDGTWNASGEVGIVSDGVMYLETDQGEVAAYNLADIESVFVH